MQIKICGVYTKHAHVIYSRRYLGIRSQAEGKAGQEVTPPSCTASWSPEGHSVSINGAHRDDAEPVAVSAPALESPRERSTRPHPGQMSSALPGWEADARWAFPRKPNRVDSSLTNMYEAPPQAGYFHLFSLLILPEAWRRDFPPLLQMKKSSLREISWSQDPWLTCAAIRESQPRAWALTTFLHCTALLLFLSTALGDRFREEEIGAQRG